MMAIYLVCLPACLFMNRFIPSARRCSIHSNNLTKSMGNLYDLHKKHSRHNMNFDEFKQRNSTHHFQIPLTRTVSTSTDIFEDLEDSSSKDANGCGNNTNSHLFGIMKNSNKSKENLSKETCNNATISNNNTTCNNKSGSNNKASTPKTTPKSIYFIEDDSGKEEPHIFIIDPHTLNRHKKVRHHHANNKSLDDFRVHKLVSNNNSSCNNNTGNYLNDHDDPDDLWYHNYDDKVFYGSRTLPRDFLTRNSHSHRPSLDKFFENYYNRRSSENFLDRR